METHLIIGNIFAFISVIFAFMSAVKKKKTDLIWWQILNVFFCILSSYALYAYAALVTNAVALLRNVLAYKKKLNIQMALWLSVLCIVVGVYTNNLGIFGWFAIAASTSYTVLMYTTKNSQQMRYAMLLSSGLWLIHDFYVQSYPTVVSGILLMIWTTIQIIRYRNVPLSCDKIQGKKKSTFKITKWIFFNFFKKGLTLKLFCAIIIPAFSSHSGYGGTGRRNGLKIRWGQPRAGSIPAFRTNQ